MNGDGATHLMKNRALWFSYKQYRCYAPLKINSMNILSGYSVSTAEMEGEVDKLVYGLYGLNEAEINIIENSIK